MLNSHVQRRSLAEGQGPDRGATVDPTAFQEYFPEACTVEIPGRTNYPIEELFLEDILPLLGMPPHHGQHHATHLNLAAA